MFERLLNRRAFRQCVLPLLTRPSKEPSQLLGRQIVQCGTSANSGVEWDCAKQSAIFEMLHHAGVELRQKIRHAAKSPPDQLAAGIANQIRHFWMSPLI